jgi:hypothetical protein
VTFHRVAGHRDGDSTSCPGDALYAQLGRLRRSAAHYAIPTTGLTLGVDHPTVTWQREAQFFGALRFADGSDPASAPVVLEFQAGGSAWTPIAQTEAGSDGAWAVTIRPPTSGAFRAFFPGDGKRAAVASRPLRVDVIPKLSLHLDHRRLRRRHRVRITGTVDPVQPMQLVVERRAGGRWATEVSRLVTVQDDGRFGVRVRLRTPGSYRVTAIAGQTRRRRSLRVT